jgi:hypothetical protein
MKAYAEAEEKKSRRIMPGSSGIGGFSVLCSSEVPYGLYLTYRTVVSTTTVVLVQSPIVPPPTAVPATAAAILCTYSIAVAGRN